MNRFSWRYAWPLLLLSCVSGYMRLRIPAPEFLDPKSSWSRPSFAHPFGCGEAGLDLFSVVVHGVWGGLLLACAVTLVGFVIGAPLGAWAALRRGIAEKALFRICDLLQAFPSFLLALVVLSAVRAPTRAHLFVVFSMTSWVPFARLAAVETSTIRGSGFVEAGFALGRSRLAVLFGHVLPNALQTAQVQLGSSASAVLLGEAALSFIGFGPKGAVSLGSILEQGAVSMFAAPHVLLVGALAVMTASTSLQIAGRAIAKPAS